MAKRGVKRLHKEHDRVDEYLLNQVSKWVLYDRLGLLARDLGITQAEFTRIGGTKSQEEEQIFQVIPLIFVHVLTLLANIVKCILAINDRAVLLEPIVVGLLNKCLSVSVRTHSHRAKAHAKAKMIKEQVKEINEKISNIKIDFPFRLM